MIRYTLFLFLIYALLPEAALGQKKPKKNDAYMVVQEGEALMEEEKYSDALAKFQAAWLRDPENEYFVVRMAQAHFMLEDYEMAMTVIRPMLKKKNTGPEFFQVYGNCLDMLGRHDEARLTFSNALKRHPASGKLYMEMGIMEYSEGHDSVAMSWWEKGIEAEPGFSSNYFWAAKMYADIGNLMRASQYAEVFLNLERRVDDRNKEMSRLLYKCFEQSLIFPANGVPVFDFTPGIPESHPWSDPKSQESLFSRMYSRTVKDTTTAMWPHDLARYRQSFPLYWKELNQDNVPYLTRAWEEEVLKAGFMEPYSWWLIYDAKPAEFLLWYEQKQALYESFEAWFIIHPVQKLLPPAVSRKKK